MKIKLGHWQLALLSLLGIGVLVSGIYYFVPTKDLSIAETKVELEGTESVETAKPSEKLPPTPPVTVTEKTKEIIKPDIKTNNSMMFDQVPLNSREKTNCSPAEPALTWRGIVINAPTEVTLVNDRLVLVICGYYRIDLEQLLAGQALTLVAVDVATKAQYRGEMLDQDEGSVEPNLDAKPVTSSQVEGMATASYFNPDLLTYVDLPKNNATYDIFAEYGGHTSNFVRVKVQFD